MQGIDSRYYLYGFIFFALILGALVLGTNWNRDVGKPIAPGRAPEKVLDRRGAFDPRNDVQRQMQQNFDAVQKKLKDAERR